jgi:hypothetical protein
LVALAIALSALLPSTGCLHLLMATGIYLWDGGNNVPAECRALEKQRVVVVCRPPASSEYSFAGASRELAIRISNLLEMNVPGIEVVNQKEVDNWIDESDLTDFKDVAKAVKAGMVVHVELDHFDLYKGKTLYQGNAEVTISVYDMKQNGKRVWERNLGQILYPNNSGTPAQDKPVQHFQRDFVMVLADRIARNFYKHEANADFAMDALSNH